MSASQPSPLAQASSPQPIPAAPPTRLEIERKLSYKAPSVPRPIGDSPKKKRTQTSIPPSSYASSHNPTVYDSDSSSITSSSATLPPIITANPLSPGSAASPILSPIAERGAGYNSVEGLDDVEPIEGVGEEEDGEGEGDAESDEGEGGGDLARGMEGERVLKSGYLMKKQERRKAWKKKWFVLRTGKLAYYKDNKEYSLSRVLDLKQVHTVAPVTIKKHSFTFGIVTSKRTFFTEASSQDEMDDWVRAINNARRKLSEREEDERARKEGRSDHHQQQSISPGVTTGYFSTHNTAASPTSGLGIGAPVSPLASPLGLAQPPSPLDTTNTLSSQMAKMAMPKSPTHNPNAPPPISLITSTRMPSTPGSSRIVSATSRREPSSGSASTDYPSALAAPVGAGMASSDEDDPYFSDPAAAFPQIQAQGQVQLQQVASPVDPNKVILAAYLMKRSKGRGRKVWRKRWFYLTSQGLSYTKSHMDSRILRHVPLSSILDALEFRPTSSSDDSDFPDTAPANLSSSQFKKPPPKSQAINDENEHTFRLITAKRTFVLCAPSEEDEIKWLAGFRALLNRERERSNPGTSGPMSPVGGMALPTIMAQPPTPASYAESAHDDRRESVGMGVSPPMVMPGGSLGLRGRSATYIAKGAVADAVRRFHPEREVVQ